MEWAVTETKVVVTRTTAITYVVGLGKPIIEDTTSATFHKWSVLPPINRPIIWADGVFHHCHGFALNIPAKRLAVKVVIQLGENR
jgi:hypothetical protein